MKSYRTLAVAVLTFSLSALCFAGSFFTLTTTVNVGTKKLKAGQYEVSLKKDQAVLTDANGKSIAVPVKVEQAQSKFQNTMALTKAANDGDELSEIDLGGTTTRLMFGQ